MNTDPNPFRDSPDADRSASPSEAPDDSTRDFTLDEENETSGTFTPMSDDSDDSSKSAEATPAAPAGDAQPASGESGSANDSGSMADAGAAGQSQPL